MTINRLFFLSMLNAIQVSISRSVTGSQPCPRLSLDEMRREWDKLHTAGYEELHWSFRQIPDVMNSLQLSYADDEKKRQLWTRNTHLYGPRKCPTRDSIDFQSNCPSRYVMHHDVNRIPQNMVHARCVCRQCRYSSVDDYNTTCQPVYSITKVLRRDTGTCKYDWSFEKVPVSCACEIRKLELINDQMYSE